MYIENIGDYLKLNNVKPSYQRIKIFEYLYNKKTHPTVDEIYKSLSSEIPTLSKTTVYNTLNLFIEKGLVNLLTIEENETRYDINTGIHGHFKCNCCGKLYDFPIDITKLVGQEIKIYDVEEYHIYLIGVCKNCKIEH